MIESIVEDVKRQFAHGNMISKLILINIFVFLVIIIIKTFTGYDPNIYGSVIDFLALPSGLGKFITRPWTLFTYMFLHEGFWHLGWNMLMLYWFGRIIGDLIGDHRMLPLYILGGLLGGVFFLMYTNLIGGIANVRGASGSVTCLIMAAACVAPDYIIRLILIGDVKLKYIALFLIVLDIAMIAEQNNAGGRMAHLGGAALGAFFIYSLKRGRDITDFKDSFSWANKDTKPRMDVVHNKKKPVQKKRVHHQSNQEKVDTILDKINVSGYDSLTAEEKEILYQASKK